MRLNNVQLLNVATLIGLLSNKVTNAQYDHTWADSTPAKCAAGHAFDNASMFVESVKGSRSLIDRVLRREPTKLVPVNPDSFYSEHAFAISTFGSNTWENVFARHAFDGVAPAGVTRQMVIERLKNIAANGEYKAATA